MTAEELRACYEKHHRRLYLVALAVTLDRQTAEDAVHDALVRLLGGSRRPRDPTAYVMRAVRNAAIDIARNRRRTEPMRQEFLVGADGPHCGIGPRVLEAALKELRQSERETIVLHVYAGLSFREIAELRRRSINTVSAWYRRGLDKLRTTLKVER